MESIYEIKHDTVANTIVLFPDSNGVSPHLVCVESTCVPDLGRLCVAECFFYTT